jgi:ABC-type branched-subunit amino acid transport system substrate-binding protein
VLNTIRFKDWGKEDSMRSGVESKRFVRAVDPAFRGRRRSRIRAAAAIAVTVAFVAAGCSSSSKTAKSSSTTVAGSAGTSASTSAGATAPSSGGGGTTGITASTVTIGQLADVSGPVPGLFEGAKDGLAAWAAYVNSTGGINGRKVDVKFVDSGLNCTDYTNGIKSLAGDSFALVGTFSLVDACGEQTLKANPGLPDIEAAILNPALDPYPNVWSPLPTTPGDATTVYQYVKDKYGLSAVQHAASLWGSTEQFDYNEQAAAMEAIGYKIIYNRGFSPLETNYTADILRMKNEGVQVVDETDDAVGNIADFLNQAAQQNFHPKAVISSTAYDTSFFKLLGNPSYADNVVIYLEQAMYLGQDDSQVPEIGTMTQWVQKVHPGASMNLFVVDGWAAGLLFQQALEKAGSNPTQADLTAALKGITSFTADGLLPTENIAQHKISVCDVIVTVHGTNFVRTDPASSGFECNGTYVPYTGS